MGAGPGKETPVSETPSNAVQEQLDEAARRGDAEGITAAIAAGAQVNFSKGANDNVTALHLACYRAVFRPKTAYLEALIEAGADAQLTDAQGRTALHMAALSVLDTPVSAAHGAVAAMKLLLKAGAQVNAATKSGLTTLHITARTGHTEAVKMLLDAGADLHAKTTDGRNVLGIAVESRHLDLAKYFLGLGVSIDTNMREVGHGGGTLIYRAVCFDSRELFTLIAPYAKGELLKTDENGQTYLFTCSDNNVLDDLIKMGLPVNHRDLQGRTALHMRPWSIHAMRALIRSGADVNAQDGAGNTILHLACAHNVNRMNTRRDGSEMVPVINYLLVEGADPTIVNNESKRPIEVAEALNYKPVINRLASTRPVKLA